WELVRPSKCLWGHSNRSLTVVDSRKQTKSNFTALKTKGMLSFYNGIFHWIKIAPFTALIVNTVFIASVVLLYIWTKGEKVCWKL
uniref:Uncharacterized protein n=1 Tax=Geospiza parvula TaxID=87175 RepID=A0A8C3Q5W3_GEOPR